MSDATTIARAVRPRLGFLGAGWIGRHRMERILESGAAEAGAICDSSPEVLAEAVNSAPLAKTAGDFDELLAADLDGIVIATPSALHADQSIRALERGLAVFCQKPLGRTAEEAAAVVHTAEAVNRLLGVDLSYRYTEGMQRIREAVAAGTIGDIYACDLVFHNAYGPDKPWFYDARLSGGGCVMDLGVHLVDLALWTLGWPEVTHVSSRLFAAGRPLAPGGSDVEDYAVATLDLSTGAVARIACSWRLSAGCDAVISAAFYGTQGGLALRNVNGSFYDFIAEHYRGTARTLLAAPPDAWGGRAAVAWAAQLAGDRGFDPEIRRVVEVAAVLDAIYRRRARS
jgi:predicted dehydrogenase